MSAGETDVFISKFDTNGDLMCGQGRFVVMVPTVALTSRWMTMATCWEWINHHEADLDPGVGVHLVPGNSKFLVKLDAAGGFVDAFRVARTMAYGYISVRTIGMAFISHGLFPSDSADFIQVRGPSSSIPPRNTHQTRSSANWMSIFPLVWVKQLGIVRSG
ncbi:MAG: hypothetical protein IPG69_07410 [Flavobacteriales bacterium]|nr:hypothetical protein [Flavobacteriales bacterium]